MRVAIDVSLTARRQPGERVLEEKSDRSVVLNRLSRLPPFHPTVLRLLSISIEGDSAVDEYEDIFGSDPALAADLLLVANSAEFGFQARVSGIRHAVAVLGLERVSSLSFTIAMQFYLRRSPRMAFVQPIWSHSLATACISETLGKTLGAPHSGLYSAALVHDVGRLGLLMSMGQGYADLLAREFQDIDESISCELTSFGSTHMEAGEVLAQGWGFPAAMCSCIRRHHAGSAATKSDEVLSVVRSACEIAAELGYGEVNCASGERRDGAARGLTDELLARPELAPERLRSQVQQRLAYCQSRFG
jgi:HD-like signal output (HDOD) protein